MNDWLARVVFPEGTITLLPNWEWRPELQGVDQDDVSILEIKAMRAGSLTGYSGYEYSPADGQPGIRLAHIVAQKLGGRAETPAIDRVQRPGLMY
jgi:hypothetical protein